MTDNTRPPHSPVYTGPLHQRSQTSLEGERARQAQVGAIATIDEVIVASDNEGQHLLGTDLHQRLTETRQAIAEAYEAGLDVLAFNDGASLTRLRIAMRRLREHEA